MTLADAVGDGALPGNHILYPDVASVDDHGLAGIGAWADTKVKGICAGHGERHHTPEREQDPQRSRRKTLRESHDLKLCSHDLLLCLGEIH